jgi:hypothetical protein
MERCCSGKIKTPLDPRSGKRSCPLSLSASLNSSQKGLRQAGGLISNALMIKIKPFATANGSDLH